ncbi:MAG: Diacylglycerol O-acyltransferase [Actinomycetota bacterium]|nr:Diacylglycerol O-acyltransferase [Actinomycetota bacterium]
MSTQDALWLTMDRPNNLMVIDSLMWFSSELDPDRVRSVITERLVDRFAVFSARPVQVDGDWRWEADTEFDLDNHLRTAQLPAPGGFDELRDWVGSQRSIAFDRAHPLWTATIVTGFHPEADVQGSAMMLRTHHSLADGVRLTQVMFSMCDVEGDPVPVGKTLRRSTTPVAIATSTFKQVSSSAVDVAGSSARTAARAATAPVKGMARLMADPYSVMGVPATLREAADRAAALVRNPARLTDVTSLFSSEDNRPVNDVSSTAKLLLASPSVTTVWSGEPGVAKGVGWAPDLSLPAVKAIGRATGTTVNDVLLGAVSGALTRYLRGHGDDAIDEVMWMVPVSIRPFDPAETDELGNHFALVALRMPLGIADISERLAEIHRRMDRIKSSDEPLITFSVQWAISGAPRPVAKGLTNYFANKAVGVLTNVPGPRGPIGFAGTTVAGTMAWAPCSGDQVMTICIFSYNGRVSVGFGTDATLIPDADRLGDLFHEEFDEMCAAFPTS